MIIYFILVSSTCLSANDKKGCESIDAQPFVVRKVGMRTPGFSFPSLQISDFDGTVISSVEVF